MVASLPLPDSDNEVFNPDPICTKEL